MENLTLFRAIAILIIVVIGEFQIRLYINSKNIINKSGNSNFYSMDIFPAPKKTKLPIVKHQYPENLIGWAENYLKLPVWSPGYHNCNSKESEVNCFEVYRAAKIIEHWDNHSRKNETNGLVFVNITNEPFFDRLSMLYHGFQIAIFSNRALYVDRNAFLPIQLPDSIKQAKNDDYNNDSIDYFCQNCFEIPVDYKFGCFNIDSIKNPNVTFHGASYPQVLYTHHPIGSYLYDNFGFHSAHFIGNFLFGSYTKPNTKIDTKYKISIEGWNFDTEKRFAHPSEIHSIISKCNSNRQLFEIKDDTIFVTNEILNKSEQNKYSNVITMIPNDDSEKYQAFVFGFYSLISSEFLIYTFGSRMGFWANALLGYKASILNTYDGTCFNLSFSQQGSLFHTESPPDLKEVFRINNHFYPCGVNDIEASRYIENLLW